MAAVVAAATWVAEAEASTVAAVPTAAAATMAAALERTAAAMAGAVTVVAATPDAAMAAHLAPVAQLHPELGAGRVAVPAGIPLLDGMGLAEIMARAGPGQRMPPDGLVLPGPVGQVLRKALTETSPPTQRPPMAIGTPLVGLVAQHWPRTRTAPWQAPSRIPILSPEPLGMVVHGAEVGTAVPGAAAGMVVGDTVGDVLAGIGDGDGDGAVVGASALVGDGAVGAGEDGDGA